MTEDDKTPQKPETWPSVRQDDAVERTGRAGEVTGEDRCFDPDVDAPTPEKKHDGASPSDGRMGRAADPAEGKRKSRGA